MPGRKIVVALLSVSDILLGASVMAPWMKLSGGAMGSTVDWISPVSLIQYEVTGYESPMTSLPSAVAGVIYIATSLGLVSLTIPVIIGALRGITVAPAIARSVLLAIVSCFIVLLAWALSFGLAMVYPYPGAVISAGIPMALGGTLMNFFVLGEYHQ